MYLIIKNKRIIFNFKSEPVFENGTLSKPISCIDVLENEVKIILIDEAPNFVLETGCVFYDNGIFYLENEDEYNNKIASIPKVVPQALTPRQIRIQLTNSGLRQQVEDIVASSDDYALKDWWEYSLEYFRDNHVLTSMAEMLKLTPEQLDDMFIKASKL